MVIPYPTSIRYSTVHYVIIDTNFEAEIKRFGTTEEFFLNQYNVGMEIGIEQEHSTTPKHKKSSIVIALSENYDQNSMLMHLFVKDSST